MSRRHSATGDEGAPGRELQLGSDTTRSAESPRRADALAHDASDGVHELGQEQLAPLLRLKYHDSIADAIARLGMQEDIDASSRALRDICIS